jgi:molybdopterin molybdotransferase
VAAVLLSVGEAQELVLERVRPLAAEDVPVAAAAGRILAEDAAAAVDLPPFPSSAMDGFAVRAVDLPGRLPLAGRVSAGVPATAPLRPGEAMAIATGGVVPEGADAVVPVEDVVVSDNDIDVPAAVPVGANIRPRGGDLRRGELVAGTGSRLTIAAVGALAAAGIASTRCGARPRVAVLATGTELARPGGPLRPGQVYEANAAMIAAAVESAGACPEVLPAVEDTDEAHRAAIATGLEADVLVTTGGVSVGTHDLVRRTETDLGVEEVFWRVAVKPGKPVAFGVHGGTLVFGLPGNPVSSLVGFELFVRPALLALQGAREPRPPLLPGLLAAAAARNPLREEFLRARVVLGGERPLLEPLGGQESHMIARAAAATALVRIPRGQGVIAAGAVVEYLPLR